MTDHEPPVVTWHGDEPLPQRLLDAERDAKIENVARRTYEALNFDPVPWDADGMSAARHEWREMARRYISSRERAPP